MLNALIDALRSVDLSIYHFLSVFAGNRILDRLAGQEESNYLFKGEIGFVLYWYLWFKGGPDQERRRRAVIAIMIAAILSIIVARTIAFISPFRLRPNYDPTLVHPSYSIPLVPDIENWSSFPSDTAAYFFALAFGLAYLLRRFAIPILLYTAACGFCLGVTYFNRLSHGACSWRWKRNPSGSMRSHFSFLARWQ